MIRRAVRHRSKKIVPSRAQSTPTIVYAELGEPARSRAIQLDRPEGLMQSRHALDEGDGITGRRPCLRVDALHFLG
ncbi:MAG: hypothetical protein U0163_03480 [Gemmatimonadaceae bacterium]